MKNYVWAGVFLWVMCVDCGHQKEPARSKTAINNMLNDWHQAAAAANFDHYFGYFATDSAIYMGTDATERWTVPQFKVFAKPYFDKGKAWNFTPVQRHIYLSDEGRTAWFDEVLGTPNLGPARGTGVVVKQDTAWKIAHYNLSIPIPNSIADTVVKQVEKALSDSLQE